MLLPPQLPAPNNAVAQDMSLQTPSDVKVKEEDPVEVDSSPPDSPNSISSESDGDHGEPLSMRKVRERSRDGTVANMMHEKCLRFHQYSNTYGVGQYFIQSVCITLTRSSTGHAVFAVFYCCRASGMHLVILMLYPLGTF